MGRIPLLFKVVAGVVLAVELVFITSVVTAAVAGAIYLVRLL
jgi:hypothetical protein